jgi:hydrogenase maturation protein HypF
MTYTPSQGNRRGKLWYTPVPPVTQAVHVQRVRLNVRVEGIVQGVGFRPFVHALATRLGLAGLVGNDAGGVFIEVEGPPARVDEFLYALASQPPPLASIDNIRTVTATPQGVDEFAIVVSVPDGHRRALVSADTATCADCFRELDDLSDRRFEYPFINCTNCGPRFTIVTDVPYDRPNTTMAAFEMCAACAGEYHDPTNRRFHAQPVCCPDCGPRLGPVDLRQAARLLREGAIVAVKGLGGYHLAVVAANETAAATLRARKHREDKPFAVMAADLDQVLALCELSLADEELLISRARPIVLLPRRPHAPVAASVAPGNRELGVLLPYTPLHDILLREVGEPIVLTSGNISDEPIAHHDDDARERLAKLADAFVTHDRPIHMRTDDSVVRTFRGRPMPIRRSRGYVPEPIRLAWAARRPVLATGAELKNTFCLAQHHHAVVSHHIGDLENYATLRSFKTGIEHFKRLFDIDPAVVAHDLHPEYLSTKYAVDLDLPLIGVQHHHAHIASCVADNGYDGPVIGVAFDGTGYGEDGTIWGGEFLVADLATYRRVAHLEPVPMPGGVSAIRQPWRMAVAYLHAAFDGEPPPDLALVRRYETAPVVALVRHGLGAPLTSSAGRLFDAVAALLGIRDQVNYEGQAAIELEQRADRDEHGGYFSSVGGGVIRGADLVRAAADDLRNGVDPGRIAARFHHGLADATVRVCDAVRAEADITTVALSGGVFQNMLLLESVVDGLHRRGFTVLTHERVPPNDGGISLGQAAVAAARDRAG